MITDARPSRSSQDHPTVWGLPPEELHDRFWAARGIQVVRQGEPSLIVKHAELFLLTDPQTLTIFKIAHLVEQLSWMKPELLYIRLHEMREHGYREGGHFLRFHREYGGSESRMARVALTPSRRIAELWQAAKNPVEGWAELRRSVPRTRRMAVSVDGNVHDLRMPHEVMQCVRDLVQVWKTPNATIPRARAMSPGVWADHELQPNNPQNMIGSVWIGAGRDDLPAGGVVGPAVLWDAPGARPEVEDIEWNELEPQPIFERPIKVKRASSVYRVSKRAFDILFALGVMLVMLPVYPLIMLLIWIEDGRPFFFAHMRETRGGRDFPCIKFRSMRNDADEITARLRSENKADGPQFFIDPEDDPRLTKMGWLLRKTNVDELPQFINVLMGDMSVVGPRPSPRKENQYSPPWREARLSVRPGVTGLWQVMRTRQEGMDFQEWIRFDIEYVEKRNWRMDLHIIWKTILIMLRMSD
jgi:lipopolysaccharide/colanic/teichoic acid biosynthesis glycosyltransferase